jgi:hypothetical protein
VALSSQEKVRVRYHLGYLNVSPAASISFGIPRPLQTVFLVETAMSNLIEDAVGIVRNIVSIMDRIEAKLVEAQDRLAAIKLGEITLREQEGDQLDHEYKRWGQRLADTLGVPLYAYSSRYKPGAGVGSAGNIPVSNS